MTMSPRFASPAERRPLSWKVRVNMPPETGAQDPRSAALGEADEATAPATSTPVPATPVLPAQSREDTDVGWGEYRDRDDDDRLLRDRPPHWDNG